MDYVSFEKDKKRYRVPINKNENKNIKNLDEACEIAKNFILGENSRRSKEIIFKKNF